MLNFNFPEKGLGLVSPAHFEDYSSLSTDQISLSDYLYFSRYWAIYAFQLFIDQAVTVKLTLFF